MSSLLSALGIDRLSADERLRLVEEIWDSLGPEASESLPTDAQKRELDRRCEALDAAPHATTPWEAVETRALKRLGG